MNYGLYLAAAGALDASYRQSVLTNNLVNSETVGFKPDMVFGRQRLPERLSSGGFGAGADPQAMLERLGGSPTLDPAYINLRQGGLVDTGNPLDVAIEGDGFFVVQDADEQMFLTRDGRFAMDENGRLVMANNGMAVLDQRNRPIRLDRDLPVEINGRGDVEQDGNVVATLRVTEPGDPSDLVKVGGNLLQSDSLPAATTRAPSGRVLQGYIENSAVDVITLLKDVVGATKSFSANIKMMQYQDHIMGQVINTFGRVT
jgi:flagellar basal-body rod protein FlgG